MDTKIIFVKTSTGENEMRSTASHLSGDIRRALMMVDGVATVAEIEARIAPSLRNQVQSLLTDLLKHGYVEDSEKVMHIPKLAIPTRPAPHAPVIKKSGTVSELDFTSVFQPPSADVLAAEAQKAALLSAQLKAQEAAKMRLQAEHAAAEEKIAQAAAKARAEAEAQARAEAAAQAQAAAEKAQQAAELRARQEAEIARLKARQVILAQEKAAKAAQEAEAKAKEALAQQAREQDERQRRILAERQAKVLAERQAKELAAREAERQARELAAREAERQAKEQAERARELAVREAERQAQAQIEREMRELAEHEAKEQAARAAEREAKEWLVRETEALMARQAAEAAEAAKAAEAARLQADQTLFGFSRPLDSVKNPPPKTEKTDPGMRTITVTVLFFDMVAYSKQPVQKQTELKKLFNQLVSRCLKSEVINPAECIILDTGDGAAIGFMQHPEEGLEVAKAFRQAISSEIAYIELHVRMGIHLGPINVLSDMNGKPNMVGNGINDAQRVMDFAGVNQIFISRAYFDFISRLNDEYADAFRYRGVHKDKHGCEHPVYELIQREDSNLPIVQQAANTKIQLAPFTLNAPVPVIETVESAAPVVAEPPPTKKAPLSMGQEEIKRATEARLLAEAQVRKLTEMQEIEAKKQAAAQAIEAKKLAENQAKAWTQAERRATEAAKASAERAVQQEADAASAELFTKSQQIEAQQRAPIQWGKWMTAFMLLLLVLMGVALYVGPMVMSMREYELQAEQVFSEKLQRPVHIGSITARILPSPQLVFNELFIGKDNLVRVEHITADFAILALLDARKPITHLEVEGLHSSASHLEEVTSWFRKLATDDHYPVQQVSLKQSTLNTPSFDLTGIDGELIFNTAGQLVQTNLRANAGQITASISRNGDKQNVTLSLVSGTFPFLTNFKFDELHATGELNDNSLTINQLNARIADGFLQGSININWHGGWLVQGSLEAEKLALQKFNRLLTGDVKGTARFKMQHPEFKGLVPTTVLNGKFMATKGTIQGIDMIEALRTHGRENLAAGHTNFDEFSGTLAYFDQNFQFQQLKLHRAALDATGEIALNQQKLTGKLTAALSIQADKPPVTFLINGTSERIDAKTM